MNVDDDNNRKIKTVILNESSGENQNISETIKNTNSKDNSYSNIDLSPKTKKRKNKKRKNKAAKDVLEFSQNNKNLTENVENKTEIEKFEEKIHYNIEKIADIELKKFDHFKIERPKFELIENGD